MICPYCGYEYADTELKCPFCATENTGQARKQQQTVIRSLEEEAEDIRRMPKEILRQTNQEAVRVFAGFLIVIVLILILTVLGNIAIRTAGNLSEQKNLKKLEELLQKEDYDGILTLMDEIDSYEPVYDKYTEIVFTYRNMSYLEDDLEWFYESVENPYSTQKMLADTLSFAMADCMNALRTGREYLDDNLVLGNEDALEHICSQAENTLTLAFHITDEEIQALLDMDISYYSSDDVLPLAELALERME